MTFHGSSWSKTQGVQVPPGIPEAQIPADRRRVLCSGMRGLFDRPGFHRSRRPRGKLFLLKVSSPASPFNERKNHAHLLPLLQVLIWNGRGLEAEGAVAIANHCELRVCTPGELLVTVTLYRSHSANDSYSKCKKWYNVEHAHSDRARSGKLS